MMCDNIYDIFHTIHNTVACVGMRFLNCNDCVPPTQPYLFSPAKFFFPLKKISARPMVLLGFNYKIVNFNGQVNMVVRGLKELGEVVK